MDGGTRSGTAVCHPGPVRVPGTEKPVMITGVTVTCSPTSLYRNRRARNPSR